MVGEACLRDLGVRPALAGRLERIAAVALRCRAGLAQKGPVRDVERHLAAGELIPLCGLEAGDCSKLDAAAHQAAGAIRANRVRRIRREAEQGQQDEP